MPIKVGIGTSSVLGCVFLAYFMTRNTSGDLAFVSQTIFNVQANEKSWEILGPPISIKKREGSYSGEMHMLMGGGDAHIRVIVDGEKGSAVVEATAEREGFYLATKSLKLFPIVGDHLANPITLVSQD